MRSKTRSQSRTFHGTRDDDRRVGEPQKRVTLASSVRSFTARWLPLLTTYSEWAKWPLWRRSERAALGVALGHSTCVESVILQRPDNARAHGTGGIPLLGAGRKDESGDFTKGDGLGAHAIAGGTGDGQTRRAKWELHRRFTSPDELAKEAWRHGRPCPSHGDARRRAFRPLRAAARAPMIAGCGSSESARNPRVIA